VAVSIALAALFLFAYLVPFMYTGNYVAGTPKTPAPGSEIYGSLTCIVSLHLEGYYEIGSNAFFLVFYIAPGTPPPSHWYWLGTLYQGGHYYFFCNPQYVSIPRAWLPTRTPGFDTM